jgi:hypothetical protein
MSRSIIGPKNFNVFRELVFDTRFTIEVNVLCGTCDSFTFSSTVRHIFTEFCVDARKVIDIFASMQILPDDNSKIATFLEYCTMITNNPKQIYILTELLMDLYPDVRHSISSVCEFDIGKHQLLLWNLLQEIKPSAASNFMDLKRQLYGNQIGPVSMCRKLSVLQIDGCAMNEFKLTDHESILTLFVRDFICFLAKELKVLRAIYNGFETALILLECLYNVLLNYTITDSVINDTIFTKFMKYNRKRLGKIRIGNCLNISFVNS